MVEVIGLAQENEKLLDSDEMLSLGKAAEMLGVHTMTLRRWSDSGQFPTYRTVGGHRRFALSDVRTYLAQNKTDPVNDISSAWASTALVQTRQQVAVQEQPRWMKAIDAEHLRDEYRRLGHQLMGLLLQYIAAEEPNGTFLEEARRIGRLYAAYGLRAGLNLPAVLEATIFFRDILVESSLEIPRTTAVEPEANLRILRRVNQIINAIQLAVAGYYERADYGPADREPGASQEPYVQTD
jgi:excisionase family DNA binding protein